MRTASQTCSVLRPSPRTVASWAVTHFSQPLMVDTARLHSSKSTFSTPPEVPMMFMRRPMRSLS